MLDADKVFTGSIPESYDRYMVPLRAAVRRAEGLEVGMELTATVRIRYGR